MDPACGLTILAEGAIALPVTLSGGVLFDTVPGHHSSVIRWHYQFLGALLPNFVGGRVLGGWWCHLRSGCAPTRSNKCMTEE